MRLRPNAVISIGNVVSAAAGVRYFDEAVAETRADYYAARGEAPGVWRGAGAARLGLSGAVQRDDLVRVLEGRHPANGAELGRRHARSKNVAFDVTFSLPKSVSLLYALGDGEMRTAVLDALSAGAGAAHEYLQRHAAWGRAANPVTRRIERVRAELVTAAFVHRTARPVTHSDGRTTVDPQLHTHLLVASFVHRANGTWGQLDSGPLYAHAAAASAIGQAATRDALVRSLGVRVRTNPNGTFELEGFTAEQLGEFSQRHAQVVAAAGAAGATSLYGVKVAVLDSRQSKREVDPGTDLFGHWRARATAVGMTAGHVQRLLGLEKNRDPRWFDVDTVQEILGREHGLTAQSSVFTRRELVRALAAHTPLGMKAEPIEELADAILGEPTVAVPMVPPPLHWRESPNDALRRWADHGLEIHYSTPEIVALERRTLQSARSRRAEGTAVVDRGVVTEALERSATPLTPGQRAMVDAVCTSAAGVLVVEGAAGVGKTTAARVVRAVFTGHGVPVFGCAPSGRAVRGLETEAGVPSSTVASLLFRLRNQERLPHGCVVLADECSMIGPDLAELVLFAHRDRAKLVLIGDSRQLQPIDGGSLFRSLGRVLGRVEMTDVIRQRVAWDREALVALRAGDPGPLIRRYIDEGRVHQSPTESGRLLAMAGEWVASTREGHDCISLARERATVAALNAVIRDAAIHTGLVEPWGVRRACIDDVGRKRVDLGELEFAVGDRILIVGRNDRALGLVKGTRGAVVATRSDGALLIEPSDEPRKRIVVPPSYSGVTHGYAMTVHRAQGATVDVALVHGSDAADRQSQYVALSRHRLRCVYYDVAPVSRDVDGVHHGPDPQSPTLEERMLRAMSRDGSKASTLDYPQAYEPQLRPAYAPTGPDGGLYAGPSDDQLRDIDATGLRGELPAAPTWVHASVLIDDIHGSPRGASARDALTSRDAPDDWARDVVREAGDDLDTRGTSPLVRSWPVKGHRVGRALTAIARWREQERRRAQRDTWHEHDAERRRRQLERGREQHREHERQRRRQRRQEMRHGRHIG